MKVVIMPWSLFTVITRNWSCLLSLLVTITRSRQCDCDHASHECLSLRLRHHHPPWHALSGPCEWVRSRHDPRNIVITQALDITIFHPCSTGKLDISITEMYPCNSQSIVPLISSPLFTDMTASTPTHRFEEGTEKGFVNWRIFRAEKTRFW